MPIINEPHDPIYDIHNQDTVADTVDNLLRDGVYYRDIRIFLNVWLEKRYGWRIEQSVELWMALNYSTRQQVKHHSFAEAWRYITSQPELPQEDTP